MQLKKGWTHDCTAPSSIIVFLNDAKHLEAHLQFRFMIAGWSGIYIRMCANQLKKKKKNIKEMIWIKITSVVSAQQPEAQSVFRVCSPGNGESDDGNTQHRNSLWSLLHVWVHRSIAVWVIILLSLTLKMVTYYCIKHCINKYNYSEYK